MNRLIFYLTMTGLLARRKFISLQTVSRDYDRLAATYDDYFTRNVAEHSRAMVQRLGVDGKNMRALDLACGTGTIAARLDQGLGPDSSIVAVDASDAMIAQARTKVSGKVEFRVGDMLRALQDFRPAEFDVVTCGWAVGYVPIQRFLREVRRVMKPKAVLGIIENRKDTLSAIRTTGLAVMQRYPRHIRSLMDLTLRLPSSTKQLAGWMRRAGFTVQEVWDGSIDFNFASGKEVLSWVLHTGASAGFDRIMDPSIKTLCDEAFVEIIERDHRTVQGIKVSHNFVAGIGIR